ncbi:putative clathrin assembly protein [Hordeum vulgare]|nr:putative clathrin assembly protein [Hordeum vulgare]
MTMEAKREAGEEQESWRPLSPSLSVASGGAPAAVPAPGRSSSSALREGGGGWGAEVSAARSSPPPSFSFSNSTPTAPNPHHDAVVYPPVHPQRRLSPSPSSAATPPHTHANNNGFEHHKVWRLFLKGRTAVITSLLRASRVMQMQIFVKTLTGKTITLEFIDNNSFTTPLQKQQFCTVSFNPKIQTVGSVLLPTVALKTLIVIHHALREVDPSFRDELISYGRSSSQMLHMSYFKDDSNPDGILEPIKAGIRDAKLGVGKQE